MGEEALNEEALMEAYVSGDAGAFERLFRALAPSIHAFFVRSVGSGPAAEDLLQTTFLRLHGARASWRRGERVRPWLFAIAGNVRVDWLRRRRRADHPDQEIPEEVADPGERAAVVDAAMARERADRVRAALERLPEPQRVIVHLHRFEDMGFAEIGRALGISEGAAKLRAFRAYARLRDLLADLVQEDP